MKRKDPIKVARAHPTRLRAAVNAKCWDCIGRDADPQPTRRIRECEVRGCPLHHVRPYQRGALQDGELSELASGPEGAS